MSTSTLKQPPIATWNYDDRTGISSPAKAVQLGYVRVARSDSIRRRKPSGINLLKQGTSAATTITSLYDAPVVFTNGHVTMHTTVLQLGSQGGLVVTPSLDDIVRNKLLSKARNMSVNLANSLAEYRQCAEMFSSGCKSLVELIKVLHSRNPWVIKRYLFSGSTRGFGKIVSKRILEFQYGVRPLIGDINDSILALKKRSEAADIFRRVTATAKNYERNEIPGYDQAANKRVPNLYVEDISRVTSGWAIVTLNRDILNRTLGQFGFTNPLAIAYEITPFSFVLDWFFNVGEFIQSLDNSLYFEGSKSCMQLTNREIYRKTLNIGGASSVYTVAAIKRGTVGGLGSVASLRFKPNISSTHVANGLALITQALANIRKS